MQRVALITEADHGFGLSLALGLLEKGWYVFAGRQRQECSGLDIIKDLKKDLLTILPLDVTSVEDVAAAAKTVSGITDHMDLLISNIEAVPAIMDGNIRESHDYEEMHRMYDINALGHLRVVNAFLPLMDKGRMKRLCFVSTDTGSINFCDRTSWYGYSMSKAAMNMEGKIMFNRLRPEGYTFRMYSSGCSVLVNTANNPESAVSPKKDAKTALAYFLNDRFEDEGNMERKDDNRFVMRDWLGREWPW